MQLGAWGRTSLAWQEAGRGRPVLLIHCYPVDGRLFDAQLEAADAGALQARVIAPDLPGFGRSPIPEVSPHAYRTDELGVAIAELIRRLGLAHPVVGGVAIGGTIAAEVSRTLDGVAGLVLIGNKLGAAPVGPAEARERTADDAMRSGSASVAVELAAAALSGGAVPDVRTRVEQMIGDAQPRAIAALARAIAQRPDLADLVPRHALPTLVVAGLEDRISPADEVRKLARAVPGARLLEVADAGHMVPIEAPDTFTGALADLLAAVGDPPDGRFKAR